MLFKYFLWCVWGGGKHCLAEDSIQTNGINFTNQYGVDYFLKSIRASQSLAFGTRLFNST